MVHDSWNTNWKWAGNAPKGNKLVFQPSIFRCENVSFREGMFQYVSKVVPQIPRNFWFGRCRAASVLAKETGQSYVSICESSSIPPTPRPQSYDDPLKLNIKKCFFWLCNFNECLFANSLTWNFPSKFCWAEHAMKTRGHLFPASSKPCAAAKWRAVQPGRCLNKTGWIIL